MSESDTKTFPLRRLNVIDSASVLIQIPNHYLCIVFIVFAFIVCSKKIAAHVGALPAIRYRVDERGSVALLIRYRVNGRMILDTEGVVAQWCNPLTLKPEQSGGVGSISCRTPSPDRRDKGSQTRLGLLYFCDLSAWR